MIVFMIVSALLLQVANSDMVNIVDMLILLITS